MPKVKWLDKPEDHDFPAAADYLALLADSQTVTALTDKLRAGEIAHKKAKDILRAAQLQLLPVDNRSPAGRCSFDGAATRQSIPAVISAHASPNPFGPAS
jgi:hypothetical protein